MADPLGPEGGGGTGTPGGCGKPSFREPQPGLLHKLPDRNPPPVSITQSKHSRPREGPAEGSLGRPSDKLALRPPGGAGLPSRAEQDMEPQGEVSGGSTGAQGARAAGDPRWEGAGPRSLFCPLVNLWGHGLDSRALPGAGPVLRLGHHRPTASTPVGTHPHHLSMTGSHGQRVAYMGSLGHACGTPGS